MNKILETAIQIVKEHGFDYNGYLQYVTKFAKDKTINQTALINQLKQLQQNFAQRQSMGEILDSQLQIQQQQQHGDILQQYKLIHVHNPENATVVASIPPKLSTDMYLVRCTICGQSVHVNKLQAHIEEDLKSNKTKDKQQLAYQQIQQINKDFGL